MNIQAAQADRPLQGPDEQLIRLDSVGIQLWRLINLLVITGLQSTQGRVVTG